MYNDTDKSERKEKVENLTKDTKKNLQIKAGTVVKAQNHRNIIITRMTNQNKNQNTKIY